MLGTRIHNREELIAYMDSHPEDEGAIRKLLENPYIQFPYEIEDKELDEIYPDLRKGRRTGRLRTRWSSTLTGMVSG